MCTDPSRPTIIIIFNTISRDCTMRLYSRRCVTRNVLFLFFFLFLIRPPYRFLIADAFARLTHCARGSSCEALREAESYLRYFSHHSPQNGPSALQGISLGHDDTTMSFKDRERARKKVMSVPTCACVIPFEEFLPCPRNDFCLPSFASSSSSSSSAFPSASSALARDVRRELDYGIEK